MGILVINLLTHRALSPGADTLGLGWWSWVQICGQVQQHVWIISLYRPCKANGPSTTYQQHIWALSKRNWTEGLQAVVLHNLVKEIKICQQEGDRIILLTDFNGDV